MSFALALAVSSVACGGGSDSPPPPPPPPVTVTVAPATQNVLLGATQTFTATVTNATSTSVTWSVNGVTGGNATVGTIDANGLYRGPGVLPSPTAVTIRATSVSSPTSSGTATVTVTSDVVVSVSANPAPPVAGKVDIGFTQQFARTITSAGAPDQNVNWSIGGAACAGAGSPCGTINSATGLYTAPRILPNPNSVTITATSVADVSKSGSVTVTIDPRFSFAISGPSSINNGTTANFSATATPLPGTNANPSQSVNWLAPSGPPGGCTGPGTGLNQCGTIDGTGLYTAPLIAPSNPTVVINGQSVADPSKAQSPSATIVAIIVVTISPATLNIEIEGQQNFTATVGGLLPTQQNVTWSITGAGCANPGNPCGSISNPGPIVGSIPVIYTAPITIPSSSITVTATSVADITKSTSTTPTFFSTISAGLQPSGSTRAVNHAQTIVGSLTRTSTGTTPVNNAVTWSVNGVPGGDATNGFICAVGVKCDRSGVNPLPVSVSGVGSPNGDVDYVAPSSIPQVPGGTVTIRMQSQADSSRSASALVSIVANVSVNVSPASGITLPPTQTQQFSANVVATSNTAVTWDVNGIGNGNSTLGQICQVGVATCTPPTAQSSNTVEYRAPTVVPSPATVTVTATSVDDSLRSAGADVTIFNGPFIQKLLPASITALPANGTSFTLKVQGINFTTSSVILFTPTGAATKQLTSTCTATPSECTATIVVSDVGAASRPPHPAVQIQNPGSVTSNAVNLIVLDPATEQKDFASASVVTLSSASPNANNQNITVVEPTTLGSGTAQVNIGAIGFFTPGVCSGGGTPISITRLSSVPKTVEICLFASGGGVLSSSYSYTITGPAPNPNNDITISGITAIGNAVHLTLTVPSTALAGPRTIFVETPNHEKSALVGAIEVR